MQIDDASSDQNPDQRLDFRLDRTSPVPIYHQLVEQFERAIRDGRLQPGAMIETEVGLAKRLNLSRPTVRHAINELTARGLVVRRRRVGTTVTSQPPGEGGGLRSSDGSDVQGAGSSIKVLRLVFGEVDERVAAQLKIDARTSLMVVDRLKSVEGVPVALLRNWLPASISDLSAAELQANGLHQCLAQRGLIAAETQQVVGSRPASTAERDLLELGRWDSVLTITQLAYDSGGGVLDYGEYAYRADRYQLRVTSRPDWGDSRAGFVVTQPADR